MEKTALIQFITEYIASRRQPKIDAFEKEAAKRVEQGEDASVIAQERQELEARYLPRNWLTDAAKRAGQIKLVMVILKPVAFIWKPPLTKAI